jgi:hypothetical protein
MNGRDRTSWFRMSVARVAGLFSRQRRERELDDELSAHLEALAEENLRREMSADDARAAARRDFGGKSCASC